MNQYSADYFEQPKHKISRSAEHIVLARKLFGSHWCCLSNREVMCHIWNTKRHVFCLPWKGTLQPVEIQYLKFDWIQLLVLLAMVPTSISWLNHSFGKICFWVIIWCVLDHILKVITLTGNVKDLNSFLSRNKVLQGNTCRDAICSCFAKLCSKYYITKRHVCSQKVVQNKTQRTLCKTKQNRERRVLKEGSWWDLSLLSLSVSANLRWPEKVLYTSHNDIQCILLWLSMYYTLYFTVHIIHSWAGIIGGALEGG